MIANDPDAAVAPIAAAIGEPARARILYSLVDARARTSTELAVIAGVAPSTASVHLGRLQSLGLVTAVAQGKHRYYSLSRPDVASALEALHIVAGGTGHGFKPNTPHRLRGARTCYDHIAGTLGVSLFDRFIALEWLSSSGRSDGSCDLTPSGRRAFERLGVDVDAAAETRRRFAFACLDWSERRPHLGGALGAAVLRLALQRKWVARDLDSRALRITPSGRRELLARFRIRTLVPEVRPIGQRAS
jgi:DNA-binding transcriptional ArsR family regulator